MRALKVLNAVKLKHSFGECGVNWHNFGLDSHHNLTTSRSLPLSPSAPHHVSRYRTHTC